MLTANTINAAAHLAAIAAKADNLIALGYKIEPFATLANTFYVDSPKGGSYFVTVESDFTHCTCGGFAQHNVCSHSLACEREASLIALVAAHDEQEQDRDNVVLAYYAGKADTAAEWETCAICGTALEEAANGEPVSFCDRCNKWALQP